MQLKHEDIEKLEELFSQMIKKNLFDFDDERRDPEGNFRYSLEKILLLMINST